MSIFHLNVDVSDLLSVKENFREVANKAVVNANSALVMGTYNRIKEIADQKLHARKQMFMDALSVKKVSNDVWMINLDKKARWIEDGMSEHEMIMDLLKSKKAKTSKDGSKYLSVPMQHDKGPSQSTPAQQDLTSTIKSYLRNYNKNNPGNKVTYGGIDKDASGKPKLGTLAKFDIMNAPLKTSHGAGQGWGAVGQVRQGPTGIPFLQGVRIMQREVMDKKTGQKKVEKNIMTFRTVSTKHLGSGRWTHPGLEATNIIDKGVEWALNEWETKIKDQLIEEIKAGV